MAKINCAGGCGKVRDLDIAQKGAKDVGFTVSPKFWMCEDCVKRQVPPSAVQSRPQPIPQAVDPNVPFTFVPPSTEPAKPAAAPAQVEETDAKAEGAKT